MTVQQLMEKLSRLEPDLPILTHGIYDWNRFDWVIAKEVTRINVTEDDGTFFLVTDLDTDVRSKQVGIVIH